MVIYLYLRVFVCMCVFVLERFFCVFLYEPDLEK